MPFDMEAQVIVVGAGPVGLTAALLLAKQGVSVIVLDARPAASVEGSKAICIQRDSLDICARLGIADDMVAQGVTWWTGRTYFRDAELFHVELPHDNTQAFPPFVNISQASTEALLVKRAVSEPLITLRYNATVTGVRQDDHAVVATMTDGTVAGAYLIGCDGSRSIVRKSIGATFDGYSFDEQFLIADIRADLPGFGIERRFYFDPPWNPGRQVLVHPCPNGVWRIDWQVAAEFNLEAEQASGELNARIRMIIGDNPFEIVWLSVYRFHQRKASSFVEGRVLLAGDSAHIYAPFGARGLNAGFHDAENAAWKVAALLNGWGGTQLLDSYDIERGAAADENLRVTGETMRFLVPTDENAQNHRRCVLETARNDPSVRVQVNSGRLAEPFWYNDSPLTTGGSTAGFPTEPGVPRPLCAGVLCPDGLLADGTRLRSTFGGRFTIVLGPDNEVGECGEMKTFSELDSSPFPHAVIQTHILALGQMAAVIRPDGYIAAIAERHHIGEALLRAAGTFPTT
jgi:3-(3-hydroxy-phenyl)propionate hydroxylase